MIDMRSFPRPRRVVATLVVILAIAGCGTKPSKVDVSGKVTYKGQPVRPGIVQLYDPQGAILAMAELNENGTFTATDVAPGEVQVTVRVLSNIAIPHKSGDAVDAAPSAGKPITIPTKYQDVKTSGLHYTVAAGTKLDIVLQ